MNTGLENQPERAPIVSVILPVYGHARFVVAAVQSVLAQTYRPIELIIIDDGSVDASAAIIADFLKTCTPADGIEIRFTARGNKGASATINEGIGQATGEYIAILNSDDVYCPSRLQECLQLLIHQKARLVFTYVEPIDEMAGGLPYDHPWRQWYYALVMQELDVAPSISFLLLLSKNIAVSTGNLVFHRSVVHEIGLFSDYRYAHDLDFLLRYSLVEEPILLRRPLYRYRVHGWNTIGENQDLVTDETISIVRNYLAKCLSGACRNPLSPSFENWPASLNDAIHAGSPALRRALDGLLDEPPKLATDTVKRRGHIAADPALTGEITIISHELSRTGAPMLVLELARSLKHLGLAVNVISMTDGPLRNELAQSGVPVQAVEDRGIARKLATLGRLFHRMQRIPALLGRAFPTWSDRIPRISPRLAMLFVRIGDLLTWLASAITMPRLAADIHGTLVINSFASFPLAFQLLSRWNGPTFWYIHETYDPQILLRSHAARSQFDELYRSKRIQLLFGSAATRSTWSQYGYDGQVRYWSGVSAGQVGPPDDPKPALGKRRVVLSVGTSGTRKGTRWLLEAFALARGQGLISRDVELIIVGCPPPSIHAQARDFLLRIWKDDLRGSVRLVPTVPSAVLDGFYRNADLYVQSSIMECLPLTLLMAMAHRLPIVTTDVDGCKEAIQNGENGLLIPPRRIELLALALAELLNDRTKAQLFGGNAGKKFAETFSLEATIGPLATVLLTNAGGPAQREVTPG